MPCERNSNAHEIEHRGISHSRAGSGSQPGLRGFSGLGAAADRRAVRRRGGKDFHHRQHHDGEFDAEFHHQLADFFHRPVQHRQLHPAIGAKLGTQPRARWADVRNHGAPDLEWPGVPDQSGRHPGRRRRGDRHGIVFRLHAANPRQRLPFRQAQVPGRRSIGQDHQPGLDPHRLRRTRGADGADGREQRHHRGAGRPDHARGGPQDHHFQPGS